MATNRRKLIRGRRQTDLSPTEEFYIAGAEYDEPLPESCNRWEWLAIWYGGGKTSEERRKQLDRLRKTAACEPL